MIVVNVVISARAELMVEFKRGEHSSWDPDEEIQTWEKRKAVLASSEVSEDEENEDESAPAVESPKQVEGIDPVNVEPDVGAKEVSPEFGEVATSTEDIVGD